MDISLHEAEKEVDRHPDAGIGPKQYEYRIIIIAAS